MERRAQGAGKRAPRQGRDPTDLGLHVVRASVAGRTLRSSHFQTIRKRYRGGLRRSSPGHRRHHRDLHDRPCRAAPAAALSRPAPSRDDLGAPADDWTQQCRVARELPIVAGTQPVVHRHGGLSADPDEPPRLGGGGTGRRRRGHRGFLPAAGRRTDCGPDVSSWRRPAGLAAGSRSEPRILAAPFWRRRRRRRPARLDQWPAS